LVAAIIPGESEQEFLVSIQFSSEHSMSISLWLVPRSILDHFACNSNLEKGVKHKNSHTYLLPWAWNHSIFNRSIYEKNV